MPSISPNNPPSKGLKKPLPLLCQTLAGHSTQRAPVWIMRQAGRYLPEYRALRQEAKDFLTLCQTPDLAFEITLQPLRRFPLDAAVLFSDILLVPKALGLGLGFYAGEGPRLEKIALSDSLQPLEKALYSGFSQSLSPVYETLQRLRAKLEPSKALIGFVGAPWTLAAYMLEGQGSKDFIQARTAFYQHPKEAQALLELLTQACTEHAKAQIEAGADLIQIFDSWGGLWGPHEYHQYSGQFIQKLVTNLKQSLSKPVPIIVFAKGAHDRLDSFQQIGADGYGVDWSVDPLLYYPKLQKALANTHPKITLQGAFDPALISAPKELIEKRVQSFFKAWNQDKVAAESLIVNLGHGIPLSTPIEGVETFLKAVHTHSSQFSAS